MNNNNKKFIIGALLSRGKEANHTEVETVKGMALQTVFSTFRQELGEVLICYFSCLCSYLMMGGR